MGYHLSKKIGWNFRSPIKTHDPGLNIAIGGSVQFFNSSNGIRRPRLSLEVAVVANAEHVGVVGRIVGGAVVVLRHFDDVFDNSIFSGLSLLSSILICKCLGMNKIWTFDGKLRRHH